MLISIAHNINAGAVTALNTALDHAGAGSMLSDIINHGCWCAKISQYNDKTILGGAYPVDGLDEICKTWFNTRFCNDHIPGGQCTENKVHDSYNFEIVDYALTCAPDSDLCNQSTCTIDKHFTQLMVQYLMSNGVTWETITEAGVCHPASSSSSTVNVSSSNNSTVNDSSSSSSSSSTTNSSTSNGSSNNNLSFKQCVGEAPNLSIEIVEAPSDSGSDGSGSDGSGSDGSGPEYGLTLNDAYEVSYDFELVDVSMSMVLGSNDWWTVSRTINAGGLGNTDYTRYPVVLINRETKRFDFGFMPCDQTSWSDEGTYLQTILTPEVEANAGTTYHINIRRTRNLITVKVNGIEASEEITNNFALCQDGRDTEIVFLPGSDTDTWGVDEDGWGEVRNINIENF